MTNTSNKKKKKRGVSIKACIVMLAVVMLLGCAIGSTVAWLISKTDTVTNTFTYGNIDIDLFEHEYDAEKNELTKEETRDGVSGYKIIPGVDLPKDPKVIVKAGSEKCYLFVKVEETGMFADNVSYNLKLTEDNGWEIGDGEDIPANVYYKVIDTPTIDKDIQLIEYNKITVSKNITKSEIDKLKDSEDYSDPVLKFTAYAVQFEGMTDAAAAWAQAQASTTP